MLKQSGIAAQPKAGGIHDIAVVLGHADRQAKNRGVAKAVLRRQALMLSLKAQVAAGGFIKRPDGKVPRA